MNHQHRIVAFTKDWDDVPTSTTHILREMAKTMPVLWINSIGTRKPSLTTARDLIRGWRKLVSAFRPAEHKENNLRVLSPLVIPKAESRLGKWINRKLLGSVIDRELREMGQGPVEYWCFIPNSIDLLPTINDQRPACNPAAAGRSIAGMSTMNHSQPTVVYYCTDDWSKFHYLDEKWIAEKENELIRRADIVFVVSRYLEDKHRAAAGGKIYYMPHGVEYAKFAAALNDSMPVPEDIKLLKRPVIGFYGNIYPWIDFDLIEALARAKPEWSFVMIGGIFCDISRFAKILNVYFLGRREHDVLPAYCKGFDAAIIPYDMKNQRMQSVSPVKAKELLAAGVPIVASKIPELLQRFTIHDSRFTIITDIIICATKDEWIKSLERQIARKDRREISLGVKNEDWSIKVKGMRNITTETLRHGEEVG